MFLRALTGPGTNRIAYIGGHELGLLTLSEALIVLDRLLDLLTKNQTEPHNLMKICTEPFKPISNMLYLTLTPHNLKKEFTTGCI